MKSFSQLCAWKVKVSLDFFENLETRKVVPGSQLCSDFQKVVDPWYQVTFSDLSEGVEDIQNIWIKVESEGVKGKRKMNEKKSKEERP